MENENWSIYYVEFIKGELDEELASKVKQYLADHPEDLEYFNFLNSSIKNLSKQSIEIPEEDLRRAFFNMLEVEVQNAKNLKNKSLSIPPLLHQLLHKIQWKSMAFGSIMLVIGALGSYLINSNQKPETSTLSSLEEEINDLKHMVLLNQLNNQSPFERIKGVQIAKDYQEIDLDMIEILSEKLFFDDNEHVKIAAAHALNKFKSHPLARSKLLESLDMVKEPYVQILLIKIIGEWDAQSAGNKAQELLKNETLQPELKVIVESMI